MSPRTALIAGAGPVGCLTALALAHQGWQVSVWEGRPGSSASRPKYQLPPLPLPPLGTLADPADARSDPRTVKEDVRSVNLAISARGLGALKAVEPDLGACSPTASTG